MKNRHGEEAYQRKRKRGILKSLIFANTNNIAHVHDNTGGKSNATKTHDSNLIQKDILD